jgi:hypothetical protein
MILYSTVDKKNVFEIDGEAARFLFQHAPKHVDMFSGHPAAHEQHHEVFSANDSADFTNGPFDRSLYL